MQEISTPLLLCFVIKTDLQRSTDFHHIVLFYDSDSEVVGLHEFLQESPVVFILTSWKQKKNKLVYVKKETTI